MILQRLRDKIEPHLHKGQAGFRPSHCCQQHTLAVAQLFSVFRKSHNQLSLAFLDFSKAFDSISRSKLKALLHAWGVSAKITSAIFGLWDGQLISLRGAEHLGTITPDVGVLQGDTLSPFLFLLVIDVILRKLPSGNGVACVKPSVIYQTKGHYLNALAYADDILLMAEDEATIQSLFSLVEKEGASFGLRINLAPGKTEILDVSGGPCTIRTATGETVRHTQEYIHLGVVTGNWKKDFKRRKKQAWKILVSFRWLWKSNAPMDMKRGVARRLIDCILLYGAFTYPHSDTMLKMIHQAHARMLRYALNTPVDFRNFNHLSTEGVYSNTPYITTVLTGMELASIGHWARDYRLRGIHHPVIDALCFKTERIKGARGHSRSNPANDIAALCHLVTIDEVLEIACDRRAWRHIRRCAVIEAANKTQKNDQSTSRKERKTTQSRLVAYRHCSVMGRRDRF